MQMRLLKNKSKYLPHSKHIGKLQQSTVDQYWKGKFLKQARESNYGFTLFSCFAWTQPCIMYKKQTNKQSSSSPSLTSKSSRWDNYIVIAKQTMASTIPLSSSASAVFASCKLSELLENFSLKLAKDPKPNAAAILKNISHSSVVNTPMTAGSRKWTNQKSSLKFPAHFSIFAEQSFSVVVRGICLCGENSEFCSQLSPKWLCFVHFCNASLCQVLREEVWIEELENLLRMLAVYDKIYVGTLWSLVLFFTIVAFPVDFALESFCCHKDDEHFVQRRQVCT